MWLWQCLVPHPPIIIPEIGQGREKEAGKTVEAMEELARSLREPIPETVLLLTPHNDYSEGLCLLVADHYKGDLSMFGHPEINMSFHGAPHNEVYITDSLTAANIPFKSFYESEISLDHGSMVPLYFFCKYWKTRPLLIVANPIGLDLSHALEAGRLLRKLNIPGSLGLIASGDLSHRISEGAPAGFHPDGKVFDDKLIVSLKSNAPENMLQLDRTLLMNAGECGLRSAMVFSGCSENTGVDVMSYEAPFGVGYCVAKSKSENMGQKEKDPYVDLARTSITCYLKNMPLPLTRAATPSLGRPGSCFVSIKHNDGTLRGCMGTISPVRETLADEITENAITAATEDPRFLPIEYEELKDLVISVDILTEPEKVKGPENLDVREFGIIVEKGDRRGVLLPDLEGVTSVEQQIKIAASKAGIYEIQGSTIYRFKVERHYERENLQ